MEAKEKNGFILELPRMAGFNRVAEEPLQEKNVHFFANTTLSRILQR